MTGSTRAMVAAIALLVAGCSIDGDAAPRDVPEAERELAVVIEGSEAAGGERIYLIGPADDRLLRSVPRDAVTREELIATLLRGPNDEEVAAQYSTVIPPSTQLRGVRTQGQTLTIDLSDDLTELNTPSLIEAIAQIVYTASEIDGIRTVRIEIDGETQAWTTAAGSSKTELQIFDYPGFVQSAQPPYPAAPASPTG